jgi:AbiV family abortive infection protein
MKLKKEDLLVTIEKSLINAHELFKDAKILKENQRWERAYTCFQLCIEEIGKAALTYQFLLDDDLSKSRRFLKDFRDHKTKTNTAIGIDLIMLDMIKDPKLKRKIFSNIHIQGENLEELNSHKNYSLYTSIINGKAFLPSEIITTKILNEIEFYATIRLQISEQFYKIGIREFDKVLEAYKNLDKKLLLEKKINELKIIFI